MEIFNIHLFELLLIAGLALVVFGPERLPELGRMAGKQVARFLAWQQQSPELRLINDVRSEIEQEIASLRDELVRTRNQLDFSRDGTLNSLRDELRPMLSLREPPKGDEAPTGEAQAEALAPAAEPSMSNGPEPGGTDPNLTPEGPSPEPVLPSNASGLDHELLAEATPRVAPEGTVQAATRPNRLAATEPTSVFESPDERLSYLESHRRRLHEPPTYADEAPTGPSLNGHKAQTAPEAQLPATPAVSAEEVRLLMAQLERLSADLQSLISGLQAEGVIGADWAPEAAVTEQESIPR